MFDSGAKYGTINSHKSALSLLLGKVLDDDRIKRFMKGVYRMRPLNPKYHVTWNPNIVLNFLAQKWPNESLTLEALAKKTLTLLALVTAHRVQTFSLIKLSNLAIDGSTEVTIKITDIIKTSKVNSHQPILKIPFFDQKPAICPARCLVEYVKRTKSLRKSNCDFLFISYKKPHNKMSSQRLSHWIKDTLRDSGLDTSVFTAHSTRHASTSAANKLGVNIDVIRKTAGWTDSSSVFAKFYNREIVSDLNQFAHSILSAPDQCND